MWLFLPSICRHDVQTTAVCSLLVVARMASIGLTEKLPINNNNVDTEIIYDKSIYVIAKEDMYLLDNDQPYTNISKSKFCELQEMQSALPSFSRYHYNQMQSSPQQSKQLPFGTKIQRVDNLTV